MSSKQPPAPSSSATNDKEPQQNTAKERRTSHFFRRRTEGGSETVVIDLLKCTPPALSPSAPTSRVSNGSLLTRHCLSCGGVLDPQLITPLHHRPTRGSRKRPRNRCSVIPGRSCRQREGAGAAYPCRQRMLGCRGRCTCYTINFISCHKACHTSCWNANWQENLGPSREVNCKDHLSNSVGPNHNGHSTGYVRTRKKGSSPYNIEASEATYSSSCN